ncbi:hypothetical protein F5Y17DRAFT_127017 [Xylariaceae sp. FL0594]|nr:hypothetical protein F5Y17DRAFT_127017 [Xylariaceae sp. FL0594]
MSGSTTDGRSGRSSGLAAFEEARKNLDHHLAVCESFIDDPELTRGRLYQHYDKRQFEKHIFALAAENISHCEKMHSVLHGCPMCQKVPADMQAPSAANYYATACYLIDEASGKLNTMQLLKRVMDNNRFEIEKLKSLAKASENFHKAYCALTDSEQDQVEEEERIRTQLAISGHNASEAEVNLDNAQDNLGNILVGFNSAEISFDNVNITAEDTAVKGSTSETVVESQAPWTGNADGQQVQNAGSLLDSDIEEQLPYAVLSAQRVYASHAAQQAQRESAADVAGRAPNPSDFVSPLVSHTAVIFSDEEERQLATSCQPYELPVMFRYGIQYRPGAGFNSLLGVGMPAGEGGGMDECRMVVFTHLNVTTSLHEVLKYVRGGVVQTARCISGTAAITFLHAFSARAYASAMSGGLRIDGENVTVKLAGTPTYPDLHLPKHIAFRRTRVLQIPGFRFNGDVGEKVRMVLGQYKNWLECIAHRPIKSWMSNDNAGAMMDLDESGWTAARTPTTSAPVSAEAGDQGKRETAQASRWTTAELTRAIIFATSNPNQNDGALVDASASSAAVPDISNSAASGAKADDALKEKEKEGEGAKQRISKKASDRPDHPVNLIIYTRSIHLAIRLQSILKRRCQVDKIEFARDPCAQPLKHLLEKLNGPLVDV